ncbi:MAG: hypothetical protein QOI95_4392 [Acidimicrobiaceae bacterium]|jgi:hypothetical protein
MIDIAEAALREPRAVYGRTVKALTLVRTAAVIRIGIGTALTIGTGRVLRGMLLGEKPSSSFVLFARTVGIRDSLFGLGCLLSTLEPIREGETRRWVQLWLANEVADVVAALAMSRQLGVAGAASAAAAPLPLIAVDVWTLRHLQAAPGGRSKP